MQKQTAMQLAASAAQAMYVQYAQCNALHTAQCTAQCSALQFNAAADDDSIIAHIRYTYNKNKTQKMLKRIRALKLQQYNAFINATFSKFNKLAA
jgi:hypothetical protein